MYRWLLKSLLLRIVLLSFVALFGVVLVFSFAPKVTAPSFEGTISEKRASFENSIRTNGARMAYDAFKKEYGPAPFATSHMNAHLFGESLFAVEGIPGVAFCDTDFNFGCYHGFFTAAVVGRGLAVVALLDTACDGQPSGGTACQHGIGHGILEYLGHDKLEEALEACGRTKQPNPLAGCTSGVFMEYNVPLVLTENGTYATKFRELRDGETEYTPCTKLTNARFQASCYMELPQWWTFQLAHHDFETMGRRCEAVSSLANRQACIAGIAKIIPSAVSYSVIDTKKTCEKLSPEWYDGCMIDAAWAFTSNVGKHEEAQELCAYVRETSRASCPP